MRENILHIGHIYYVNIKSLSYSQRCRIGQEGITQKPPPPPQQTRCGIKPFFFYSDLFVTNGQIFTIYSTERACTTAREAAHTHTHTRLYLAHSVRKANFSEFMCACFHIPPQISLNEYSCYVCSTVFMSICRARSLAVEDLIIETRNNLFNNNNQILLFAPKSHKMSAKMSSSFARQNQILCVCAGALPNINLNNYIVYFADITAMACNSCICDGDGWPNEKGCFMRVIERRRNNKTAIRRI